MLLNTALATGRQRLSHCKSQSHFLERAAGGDANDFFFLAMAHRQLGHQDEAKQWSRPAKIFLPRALAADVARLSHSRAASNLAQPTGSQSQILLTAALMVSGVIHDVFREKTLTHVPYAAALMKCSIIV